MRLTADRFKATKPFILSQERDVPEDEQTVFNIRLLERTEVNVFLGKYEQCYEQKGRKRQVLNASRLTNTENEQLCKAIESIENVWLEEDGEEKHYDRIDTQDKILDVLKCLATAETAELSEACMNAQVLDDGTKKN